jgi:hypothetical protein
LGLNAVHRNYICKVRTSNIRFQIETKNILWNEYYVQTSGLGCVNKNSLTSGDCLENRELKYSKLYFFILLQQYIHISASLLRTYCLIYKLHETFFIWIGLK